MADAKAFRATGTILTSSFVKIDVAANNSVDQAGAGEKVFGIAQVGGRTAPIPSVTADPPEAAQAGEDLQVFLDTHYTILRIGSGGCTAGDSLVSDAAGAGVTATEGAGTSENVGAIALQTAAEGELCPVQVHIEALTTPA
ncbi:hypothetical protein K0U83_22700 [bacterium]|nr:hypothetical protein [bacterium]